MIKKFLKFILPKFFVSKLILIYKQIHNFRALSIDYGQWSTIKDWNSVDGSGSPIPWYTYPATEYLSHLDFSNFNVLEYGSGNSTLWWSKRAKKITSIEDDKEWFFKIKKSLQVEGIEYMLMTEKKHYVKSGTTAHDILIIDGQFRRECAEHAVKVGASAAMIIFDNSDWHPGSIDFLRSSLDWLQVDFHGFGPINNYTWTTSVFINPSRINELKYLQRLASSCGVRQIAPGDY
jgi:hypothetical protein